MKKWMAGVALVLALCTGLTGALAAGHGRGTVCGYVDADGDGVCDGCGGALRGYVDADGDGVCDHYAAAVRPHGGNGSGQWGRRGR